MATCLIVLFTLAIIIMLCWLIVGLIFYLFIDLEVNIQELSTEKFVLLMLIGGPFAWLVILGDRIYDVLSNYFKNN